jgi:type IV secretion system protein VirB9
MKNTRIIFMCLLVMLCSSCRTVHFDKPTEIEPEAADDAVHSLKEELEANEEERRQYAIEEELKEVDVEGTVVYIDSPVYPPEQAAPPKPTGAAAVQESTRAAVQVPMKFINGVMYYPWDETFVYEIHTQPYRTTDIILEPGEEVLEVPFLSEEKVWEIGAGVSRKNGLDVQHFFVKPSFDTLTTSMIIITDRRVYHLLLKSFPNRYMAMVQWTYPPSMPFTIKSNNRGINTLDRDIVLVDPALLSFDYRMTYSIFKKPVWLPTRVYDDGRKTYIELDERMLNMESPVLFNHRNERINYRVQKNLMVIDELIEKVTLRRGSEKVTIYKKRYQEPGQEEEGAE